LLGAERAIVTATPGTTRDMIEEAVDVNGVALVFVDTAGIRSPADEAEAIGIERTRGQIEAADVAVVVLDASREWQAEDETVITAVRRKAYILLINKTDLPYRLCLPVSVGDHRTIVRGCALDGTGTSELCAELLRVADFSGEPDGPMITRERHGRALEASASAIDHAIAALRATHPPDVIAVDIMIALDHLGEIVGYTSPDAVLDRIFSEFCIGK